MEYQAEHIDEETMPARATDTQNKYFSFWLDGQLYAVPVKYIVQIVGMQPLTVLPEAPHYLKGVVNLRGDVIPVIDMKLRLSMDESPCTENTCIVIMSAHGRMAGYIVDRVEEVSSIGKEAFSDPGQYARAFISEFLSGISQQDGTIILHLDPENLWDGEGFPA